MFGQDIKVSVLDKTGLRLRTVYADYAVLCGEQGRVAEPAENFEDSQDVLDTIQAMREAVSGEAPRNEEVKEGVATGIC